jgi:hypothetical protein
VEDQVRPAPVAAAPRTANGWIVSPAYDLLFLANLGWLVLLVPGLATRSDTAIDFWQIYFLTLPHRWLTLFLVLSDPDRRGGRGRVLVGVALAALVLVVGVYLGTGALACLALADYVWNAWHFAAQHAGVLRMYSRKVGGGPDLLERWGTRAFITYAALRTAGWATGWLETDAMHWLRAADLAMLGIPVLLGSMTLSRLNRQTLGKTAYVLSICGLYSGLILALTYRQGGLVVVFATASSMFHAVEYMAVVTHYAQRRRTVGSPGRFRVMANHWLVILAAYAVVLGTIGVALDHPDNGLRELWLGANLWMALVHYAYDGMIWKLRRPDTAKALGV